MAEETLTLHPYEYDKLGTIHCGVTKDGVVIVAGDVKSLEDGEEVLFERAKVRVKRQGDAYLFEKAA